MGRGKKSLLCDPASELRLGGREKKKGEENKWDGKKKKRKEVWYNFGTKYLKFAWHNFTPQTLFLTDFELFFVVWPKQSCL